MIDNVKDEREYITFCNKIAVWDPKEYFRSTLKQWKAFTMIISGSSKAGKSMLLKSFLIGDSNLSKQFDFIIIFSKTLVNGFYSSFLETQLMFKDFNPGVIKDFMRLSEVKKKQGKSFKWLVILDDIVSNKSKYIEEITDLFYTGRHYGGSIIFLTQKASLMQTGWVANCMCFISLFAGSRNEKTYIAEKVLSDIIDEDFSNKKLSEVERIAYLIQSHICKDYNSLVMLPYEKQKLFQYKAPLLRTHKKQAESIFTKFFKSEDKDQKEILKNNESSN